MQKKELIHAFVLSCARYGDRDAILRCLSAEKGMITLFVKGVYAPKCIWKAYLFPLNKVELLVSSARNTALARVEEVHPLVVEQLSVGQSSMMGFVAQMLSGMLPEGDPMQEIYQELALFHLLLHTRFAGDIHIIFLIRLMGILGFAPLLCAGDFLDLEQGRFSTEITPSTLGEMHSQFWRDIQLKGYQVALPKRERNAMIDHILRYCENHLPYYKEPLCLEVYRAVF